MHKDDCKRPRMGVVVTLLEVGDGTSRLIMDDVHSDEPKKDTSWKHDCFFTHKVLNSKAVDEMALPDEEFALIGSNLVLRLLALSGRVK
jgi:hypothetical protein